MSYCNKHLQAVPVRECPYCIREERDRLRQDMEIAAEELSWHNSHGDIEKAKDLARSSTRHDLERMAVSLAGVASSAVDDYKFLQDAIRKYGVDPGCDVEKAPIKSLVLGLVINIVSLKRDQAESEKLREENEKLRQAIRCLGGSIQAGGSVAR